MNRNLLPIFDLFLLTQCVQPAIYHTLNHHAGKQGLDAFCMATLKMDKVTFTNNQ